jgi:hypothetical protein
MMDKPPGPPPGPPPRDGLLFDTDVVPQTADSTLIDSIPLIYLIVYLPFNFVVIKSLEKKGLRFTVRRSFNLKALSCGIHHYRR